MHISTHFDSTGHICSKNTQNWQWTQPYKLMIFCLYSSKKGHHKILLFWAFGSLSRILKKLSMVSTKSLSSTTVINIGEFLKWAFVTSRSKTTRDKNSIKVIIVMCIIKKFIFYSSLTISLFYSSLSLSKIHLCQYWCASVSSPCCPQWGFGYIQ